MRCLIQRASEARVSVDGQVVGQIGPGLVILVWAMPDDTETDAKALAGKVSKLRIFRDEQDRMNRSVLDIGGELLAVSQFTLYGDCKRGNRPSYIEAAPPEKGLKLYEEYVKQLRKQGLPVETGTFQAEMEVRIVNDGPVTLILESTARTKG